MDENDEYRLELISEDEEDSLNHWDNAPTEFLCDITGQIRNEPVITPEGHVFEKKTIEIWMEQAGQVNPISQIILLKKDLKVDAVLQKRIMEWTMSQAIEESVENSMSESLERNDDLYNFSS